MTATQRKISKLAMRVLIYSPAGRTAAPSAHFTPRSKHYQLQGHTSRSTGQSAEQELENSPERWSGDITYVWTDGGWLYLAVVIDLLMVALAAFVIPATEASVLIHGK